MHFCSARKKNPSDERKEPSPGVPNYIIFIIMMRLTQPRA